MMTAAFIVAGVSPPGSVTASTVLILAGCTAVYTVVWCFFLPQLVRWVTHVPLLLLLDIILSALPGWVSGGWLSPFAPFALGALILPGAIFHWRGVIGAVTGYVFIDQLVGWTTWPLHLNVGAAVPMLALGYIRPMIAAVIWPLSFEAWKWHTARKKKHLASPDLLEHILPSKYLQRGDAESGRIASGLRDGQNHSSSAWRTVHQPAQTLERVPVALHSAIQQAVSEAEERGLQVRVSLAEQEPLLPQSHIQLLAKAVEVGLDNIQCHAATCEAELALVIDDQHIQPQVVLSVRDHGNGLLDGTADLPGFHQIKRLRYRLAEVEGTLDVREDDGGGVLFIVRIPTA
jgi:hypothetical protein